MNIIIAVVQIFQDIRDKRINIYAGHAALFILMSLIPFAMATISVCRFLSPDILNSALSVVNTYVGETPASVINYIVKEAYSQSSRTFMNVTLISALWVASSGTFSIERGLNIIYRDQNVHGYIRGRIICLFLTIGFMVMMWGLMLFIVFGGVLKKLIAHFIPAASTWITTILEIRFMVAIPLLLLFLMVIYTCYPGRRVRFRDQFWGAVFSSVSIYLFTLCFEKYINNIGSISYIYGSLAAIMFFGLWAYFTMMIMLYGAEINAYLHGTR